MSCRLHLSVPGLYLLWTLDHSVQFALSSLLATAAMEFLQDLVLALIYVVLISVPCVSIVSIPYLEDLKLTSSQGSGGVHLST